LTNCVNFNLGYVKLRKTNLWLIYAVRFAIEHRQIFTHHHAPQAKEVAEVYRQAHGFNDDGH
jgi:hypothetical protein